MATSRSDALVLFGVTGDRPQDDLPCALCDGQAGRFKGPGNRRRSRLSGAWRNCVTRKGQHRAIGGVDNKRPCTNTDVLVQLCERRL